MSREFREQMCSVMSSYKGHTSGSICAMYGCNNYRVQKGPYKSFFRMPRDIKRLTKWINACKRSDLDELFKVKEPEYFNRTYLVCSDHFEERCFRNKDLHSQGLLPDSIPTLKLYDEESEEKIETVTPDKKNPIKINKRKKTDDRDDSEAKTEITRLKLVIDHYEKKLKNKNSLISKYKKRYQVLKQKLAENKKKNNGNVP